MQPVRDVLSLIREASRRLREIIAVQIEDESPIEGEIEVDESYFGGHRKGKRVEALRERWPHSAPPR